MTKLLIGGTVVAIVILMGFAFAFVFTGGGVAADFDFNVYQGEDELGGSDVNFSGLLEVGKPVVLNFWGGTCPACVSEMPALQAVYNQHTDDIVFLGLDVGVFTGFGNRQDALDLLERLNITYPTGAPPDGTAVRNYRVLSMPTTIFFGSDGKVFRRWDGAINESQMNGIVNDMLAAASTQPATSG